MQKLTIGQMARLNRISEKTLRLYHEKGLLSPAYVDPHTGYRYYSTMQSSDIDLIQTLNSIGIPLRQIQSILHSESDQPLRECLEKQNRYLLSQKRALEIAQHTANKLLQSLDAQDKCALQKPYTIKHLPQRRVLCLAAEHPGPAWATAFRSVEAWEYCLRDVKSIMQQKGIPQALFHHIGGTASKQQLIERDFSSCKALLFVDEGFHEGPCSILPEGDYMTLLYDITSSHTDVSSEEKCLRALLNHLEADGYEIAGDYVGEVVAESTALGSQRRKMLVEMQVPIRAANRKPGDGHIDIAERL